MPRYHLYHVYILKCSDNSYYTGVTGNLAKRFSQHESGYNKESYTHSRRPVELVFSAGFTDIDFAIKAEKQIKKWSRKKKEALINEEFELLPGLSKKKFIK